MLRRLPLRAAPALRLCCRVRGLDDKTPLALVNEYASRQSLRVELEEVGAGEDGAGPYTGAARRAVLQTCTVHCMPVLCCAVPCYAHAPRKQIARGCAAWCMHGTQPCRQSHPPTRSPRYLPACLPGWMQ